MLFRLWGGNAPRSRAQRGEHGMKHLDLGELRGPLLIFGGIYSNIQALDALCALAKRQGIAPDHMICTGDIVAYCGAPSACVAKMRALGCPVVAGNCEIQLGQDAPDCGCGFEEGTTCDILSVGWYTHARATLSEDDKAWLAARPDIVSFHHEGERYAVIHGGTTDVARFIWPSSPAQVFAEEWAAVADAIGPVDHVIAGHCGVPFVKELGYGRWLNAGVIGMPAHDGRRETWYMIIDGRGQNLYALAYDAEAAARDMSRLPALSAAYQQALLTGYWPSEDVLPPDVRVPSLASG